MSEYVIVETAIHDTESLRQALSDLGVPFEEARETPLTLFDYHGRPRPQQAQFVVRRAHLTSASNDLGWAWNAERRAYEAIASEYDVRQARTQDVMRQVAQRHTYHQTLKLARTMGYAVLGETRAKTGHIQLRVRKV